jgi:hypothetical protein
LLRDVRRYADNQLNWASLVRPLRPHKVVDAETLSISGEAPKDFVWEQRRGGYGRPSQWIGYIAKVGYKHYPIESITEHLVTRIGQICGLNIAVSKLSVVNGQLRFLSQYFLDRTSESLVHGAEIFEPILSKQMVEEIAKAKAEADFYTFQMIEEAVHSSFHDNEVEILKGLVQMITFDALIGNQDRHLFNWAVIVSVRKGRLPRFSPIYDTARALFWDKSEQQVKKILNNRQQLEGYINRSRPMIGWEKERKVRHFNLVRLLWRDYPPFRSSIRQFTHKDVMVKSRIIIVEVTQLKKM